jgi:hypothetical protein
MRPLFLSALVVLGVAWQQVLGQTPAACRTFATLVASDVWIGELRQQPLAQQLLAVRQRVQCDTVLRRQQLPGDVIRLADRLRLPANDAQRQQGIALLYVIDEHTFYSNDAATAARFEQVLAKRQIRTIYYFESGPKGAAIYGTRAANGVVILSSKKPKHR